MGCNVFANDDEIACKAGANKVIAEFPDVCMSPPSPPAGPIPVPYPDTSFSKDMQEGSKTVVIGGKEVMLKDKSFYKTSPLGDEAATNTFGGNVASHVITGKTYCVAWSMDVKVEGQNVDRHTDMTTSNHRCSNAPPGTGPLTATLAEMAKYVVRDVKDAARWRRHVDLTTCNGNHTWVCNEKACATCWQPPCPENAQKEQENYDKEQSGTQEQKVKAHQETNRRKRQKRHEPSGLQWEEDCVAKVQARGEKIQHIGYAAHCSQCHMEGDLDIVTTNADGSPGAVIECKRRSANLEQMQQNIGPIARQCFPSHQLQVMTAANENQRRAMNGTFSRDPNWRPLNVTAVDP